MTPGSQQTSGIVNPHEHDVLSGRGNFVNYHAGNEHFRGLVRKYKLDYVQCPKPQKGKFSKIIVDEIKNRNPPGRFLKQDANTKLWYDIGEKKSLDKTRQALREGAPDIFKEIGGTDGEGSDDDDAHPSIVVQKNVASRRASAPVAFSNSDLSFQFVGNASGMQSPNMTRNLLSSGGLISPGIISPGLLMGLSPDMGQFSSRSIAGMGRMIDPSALPGPPLQTPFDNTTTMNQMALPHPNSVLSGGMTTNQMANSFGNNTMGSSGMISPQHIQLQNQISAQQAAMNHLYQQLQQQQQQLSNNHTEFAELQMLQNKLASMRQQAENLTAQNMFQNSNPLPFEPQAIDHMPPPPRLRQQNVYAPDFQSTLSSSTAVKQQQQQSRPRVDTLPGHNPRRMPPPSLMKREDSMKMDKVFPSPVSAKKKYDGNGSSAHLSAMSLSIGDMQEEGNLSSVFDSSLRISDGDKRITEAGSKLKMMLKDRSSGTGSSSWDPNSLEMSVNTIGTKMSEAAGMSYGTLGDPNLHDSDGNMSLGKVFEDPDKD